MEASKLISPLFSHLLRLESDDEDRGGYVRNEEYFSDDHYCNDCCIEDCQDCLFETHLSENLFISIKYDEKDRFVSIINSQFEKPKMVPPNVLLHVVMYGAKKCTLALFNGETDQEVMNLNSLIPRTGRSILHEAIDWLWFLDYLLHHHNVSANLRSDCVGEQDYQMKPLNFNLYCYSASMIRTSSKLSIFAIILHLLVPGHKLRKSTRWLYWKTKDVEEEIIYYATQGKIIELAALLMIDREKVLSPSFFQELYPFFFQRQTVSDSSSSLSGSMSLRNFIVSKLAGLAAMKVKPGYDSETDMMCKKKEARLMSTLLLLEVFERAGEALEAYLGLKRNCVQEQLCPVKQTQATKEVAWLLQKAGFNVTFEETPPRPSYDVSIGVVPHIIKSEPDLTQAEYMLICNQTLGHKGEQELHNKFQKNVKKNGDLANSNIDVPYAKWRKDSGRHIHEATKFLFESLKAPPMINLSSNEALHRALKLLRDHPCLWNWTSENSIFELLCILCWPELSETLETIRLAACNTMEIGMISCHYIKDRGLIALAALLMVAREKLIVGNTSQDENCYSYVGSTIRQCIMLEIQNLIDEEIRTFGRSSIGKSTQSCKDEKAVMLSALQLFEVFESSGSVIGRYLQSKRYKEITKEELAEDLAWLLKKAGFCLKQRESSLVEKMVFTGVTNGPKRMSQLSSQHASTSFCSAVRSYHTFRISISSFGLKPSLTLRSKVSLTTEMVKPQISRFSFNNRWAFVLLAINKRVKRL